MRHCRPGTLFFFSQTFFFFLENTLEMGISGSHVPLDAAPQQSRVQRTEADTSFLSSLYPKHFFVVSGSPKLKYVPESSQGPLLFHLDEAGIYKSSSSSVLCYPIAGSVPTKQKLELKLLAPSEVPIPATEAEWKTTEKQNKRSVTCSAIPNESLLSAVVEEAGAGGTSGTLFPTKGRKMEMPSSGITSGVWMAQLKFDVAVSKFVHRICVYVGVEVAFVKSKGVVLSFNDHEVLKDQHCVLDVYRAYGGTYVTKPFPIRALEPCRFVDAPYLHHAPETVRDRVQDLPQEKQKVVQSAPIAIVLYMMDEYGTDPSKTASVLQKSRDLAKGVERESYVGEVSSSGALSRIPRHILPFAPPSESPKAGKKAAGSLSKEPEEHVTSTTVPNSMGHSRRGLKNASRDSAFSFSTEENEGKRANTQFEGCQEGERERPDAEGSKCREELPKPLKIVAFNTQLGESTPSSGLLADHDSPLKESVLALAREEEQRRRSNTGRHYSTVVERYSCIQYSFLGLPPDIEMLSHSRELDDSLPSLSVKDTSSILLGLGSPSMVHSFSTEKEKSHPESGNAKNEVPLREERRGYLSSRHNAPSGTTAVVSTTSASRSPSAPLEPPRVKKSVVDKTSARGTFERGPVGGMRPVGRTIAWDHSVAQQVLQIGPEVYALEDVFAIGHHDSPEKLVSGVDARGNGFEEGVVGEGEEGFRNEGITDAENESVDYGGNNETCSNSESEEDEDNYLCVVCLVEPKNTAMLPCRHMCCCQGCARRVCMSSNRCPICRTEVETTLKCTM